MAEFPALVRTLGAFSATNPWKENRPAQFSIAEYSLGPGAKGVGIQFDSEPLPRMLPQSLAELWKQGRVQPEALPGLLRELQPTLLDTDYALQADQFWNTQVGVILLAIFGLVTALLSLFPFDDGGIPFGVAAAAGAGFSLLILGILFMVKRWHSGRCRSQMTWILNYQAGSRARLDGITATFFKMWAKACAVVFAAVLVLFAAVMLFLASNP